MYSVEEIRNIVQGLREFYPSLGFDSTLRDLEKAIENFGVDVKYSFMTGENENVSGYLMVQDSKPVIVINAAENEKRRRFTMAHELGHLILHWNWLPGDSIDVKNGVYDISFRRSREDYSYEDLKREGEANTFAGEFLLPFDEIIQSLKNKEITNSLVDRLSREFNVSNQCASVRVYKLQQQGEL